MKLLSIAVPSYNAGKTLGNTLSSLCLEEVVRALDIIVVDDGSTDDTAQVALSFVRRCPESVRLVQKANGGHGSAVNAAMDAACGKYFKIVDADDRLDPKGFAALVKRLGESQADIVAANYMRVPAGGERPQPMLFPDVEYGKVYPFARLRLDGSVYLGIHSINIKTNILREHNVRLQEHTFYVDAEYGLLPIPYVNTVEFFQPCVYLYSVGNESQSVSAANFVRRYDDHSRVVRRMVRFSVSCQADGPQRAYIDSVLRKLCFTQYMLAVFYDEDTNRGKARARDFDRWLSENGGALYGELGESLYIRLLRLIDFRFLPRAKFLKTAARRILNILKKIFPKRHRLTY